mgnify:CR=1 FL=1
MGPADVIDAPYRISYQAQQTPAHLALVCAMAGVPWVMRDDLSVADLGCGRGYVANTLAAANPGWQVTGIDHSPMQIAEAVAMARRAGLSNVAFAEADLGAFDDDRLCRLPTFDVVMLHGLWTWVSDEVRDGIRRLIRHRLRPGGVVYVGYNAMPAAGADAALQRLLLHAAGPRHAGLGSVVAAERAIAQLRTLAAHLPLPSTPMLKRLLHDPPLLEPAFVAHEFLTEHWRPVFHDALCASFADCKLDFVGSCNLFENLPGLLADPAQDRLLRSAPSPAARELLKDLCLPRSFRADVFVRGARRGDAVRALDAMVVAAVAALPEQSPVLDTGVSRAALPQAVWETLRSRLAGGAWTVADLRAVNGAAALDPAELLAILVGAGLVQPVWHSFEAAPLPSAARFNRVAAELLSDGGEAGGHFALASHVAAGGVPADALDLALVAALSGSTDAGDPATLAGRLQPAATPERRKELAKRVAARLADHLPVWRLWGLAQCTELKRPDGRIQTVSC